MDNESNIADKETRQAILDGLANLPYADAVKLERILKESPEVSGILESLLIRKYQAVRAGDTATLKQILQDENKLFETAIQALLVNTDS